MMAAIPVIIAKFNTFAPTILPIDKSGTPLRAAVIPVTSSGREVPMAITESPISAEGMPIAVAMPIPEVTSKRLPTKNKHGTREKKKKGFCEICFRACLR